jgi:hypothetical protein
MKQEELVEEVVDASSLAAGIGPSKEPRKKEEELVKFYRSCNPQMSTYYYATSMEENPKIICARHQNNSKIIIFFLKKEKVQKF